MINEQAKNALKNQIKLFSEIAEESSQTRDELLADGKHTNNLQKTRDGIIYGHLSRLYKQEAMSLVLIGTMLDKLSELPNSEKLDSINKELTTKVEETLKPIAEEIKKYRDIEKNAKDIYR
ncbi:hypothetical protein [Candidatus Nitrosocosmicus sp. SS]|jgi:hypothetical protein|uniref:hypothetical protein n=1 Tax=Candidatus Nitrosocosmicus agrestis TaxID=2563600 RepID=UPI00122E20DF|nr:hypothetical protein [Candidatus Nitrosocosmicus sp. SS]KAA2279069.1 hypothetical protein F1Z66_14425 [Candidatus Nitrosocosmicus sp. SS]KAF0867642.1 hypothetical protein E5N71_14190 [Candidatus Nitrosocosmicus sp. SS]